MKREKTNLAWDFKYWRQRESGGHPGALESNTLLDLDIRSSQELPNSFAYNFSVKNSASTDVSPAKHFPMPPKINDNTEIVRGVTLKS